MNICGSTCGRRLRHSYSIPVYLNFLFIAETSYYLVNYLNEIVRGDLQIVEWKFFTLSLKDHMSLLLYMLTCFIL